jgi:membrane peptidoglycan carboxypeptidase
MPYKRSGGDRSQARQAANFLGVSVLCGAVLAGLALPAVGALGLGVKNTAKGFDDLPGELKRPTLSQASHILDANGGEIATVYSRDRTIVPLKSIAPTMQKALLAIEDDRFYQHGAVDPKGVLRALSKNAESGDVAQGASTLTQQYVKNVFIEEAGDDADAVAQATQQTAGRKIKELKYAIQIEKELGKKKILENYLNITFFGEQAYGVEAASKRYFSKSAKDLTLPESATLAGLVQSPSRYDPINDAPEAIKRRNTVLQRMYELGDISKSQADAAKKSPIGLKVSKPLNGCITAVNGAGFFCDYVKNVFLNDPVFGKTKAARNKRWDEGGLTIKTTLDPQAQKSVQDSIKNHVYTTDKVATAVSLVEPGTGKILGMGQSRPYGFNENETTINLSVDKDMGGGSGFQTGSTFKPITAAAALERGESPSKVYPSPYKMPYPSPVTKCSGNWVGTDSVHNEDTDEVGPMGMKEAMAKSVNTYFVQLISDIGICPVTTMAKNMGVIRADGAPMDQVPSITLGTQVMSPLTMANAYATFANHGVYCTPIAIESATDASGKAIAVPKSKCTQAMSAKTADTISTLLLGVVEDGTGQEAGLTDRQSAGKTGTTDKRHAAWFVGYTPNMAGAVWVGGDHGNVQMTNIRIGGVYHAEVFGADTPGPIWRDAMKGALVGHTAENFNTVAISSDPKGDHHGGNGDGNGQQHGGDNAGAADAGAANAGAANGGATGDVTGGQPGGAQGGAGDSGATGGQMSLPPGLIRGGTNGGPGTGNGGQGGSPGGGTGFPG